MLWLLPSCKSTSEKKLYIAHASSLQFAVQELVQEFSVQSGQKCELFSASSGVLYQQIRSGAPYDVFLSADTFYIDKLARDQLTSYNYRYARGKLAIWSCLDSSRINLDDINWVELKRVAIANPALAPYGRAAQSYIELKLGNELGEDQLVIAQSVAQVNQFVRSKSAELGFTSMAILKAPELDGVGQFNVLDQGDYDPLWHQACILNSAESRDMLEVSEDFFRFLQSEGAQAILARYSLDISN